MFSGKCALQSLWWAIALASLSICPVTTNTLHVSPKIKKEVASYTGIANDIIKHFVNGKGKGQLYDRLAFFVDKFGARFTGTQNLEDAIDFALMGVEKDGLENVHTEPVQVPHWVRGEESANLLQPRQKKLAMLGLGSSVGTPPGGVTAEVLVVRSFSELTEKADKAAGKIIVFNIPLTDYFETVRYRMYGASEAARVGGVAALIRSITHFSINSPHTGWQIYKEDVEKIPAACITVEDAELLDRMDIRGERIVIELKMDCRNYADVMSRNVVAELKGSVFPEQVVLLGGHLDSWDVGQGAMDNGGGSFLSWQALSVLNELGLRAKRTIRMVLFTAEEAGLHGGQQYYNAHKENISNFNLVMESDYGTFTPKGVKFAGSSSATAVVKEIMTLLRPINATGVAMDTSGGPDTGFWVRNGTPGIQLDTDNTKYFHFHHTEGDTMTVLDSHQLDLCAALWTVVAYVVADLDESLPLSDESVASGVSHMRMTSSENIVIWTALINSVFFYFNRYAFIHG